MFTTTSRRRRDGLIYTALILATIPLMFAVSCDNSGGGVIAGGNVVTAGTTSTAGDDSPNTDVAAEPADTTGTGTLDASTTTITHTIRIDETAKATIRPLLGVNAGPAAQPIDRHPLDLTTTYQKLGVTIIRTHDFDGPLDMATMYPDQNADPSLDSSYDFTASDAYYQPIIGGGFDVYLRIGDSAGTAAGFPDKSPRAPINAANWAAAALRVVAHYNDAARWGRSAVRYVEIGNEPDSSHFWDSTRDAFFDLYRQTATALKSAYPGLKIGGPGITESAYKTTVGQTWFTGFLAYCRTNAAPLDFFSWHTYTNAPADIATATAYYRAQLDAYGFATTESHITEWNTETHTASMTPDASLAATLRDGGQGAAIVTAMWIELQDAGVAASMFYRGRDPEPDRTEYYGLLGADGHMKRSAMAFQLWARMASIYGTRVAASVDSSSATSIYLLAGQASDGSIAVLLANASEQTLGCKFEGFDGVVTVNRVSDASSDAQSATAAATGVSLPAYSAQIVVLPKR
ncbi:MAG: hypothetical protein U1D55_11590 [Phycisphaerae bacterium]